MADQPSYDDLMAALRRSHDRLAVALEPLDAEQVAGPSYDDGWSIAHVASHLGSGAEIFGGFVDAGLGRGDAPGMEQFQPVWDTWNAKEPLTQAHDSVTANAAFLDRVDALPAADRERWRLEIFGMDQALTGLLQMRLAEHAAHTWDVVVALDPAATVSVDAIALIAAYLPGIADRAGRGSDEPVTVEVTTTDPDGLWQLDLGADGVRLTEGAGTVEPGARLALPAEAFARLVYGRLDPDHTPAAVTADGVTLGTLRRAFPGL